MTTPAILIIGATGQIGSVLIRELLPDHAAGSLPDLEATFDTVARLTGRPPMPLRAFLRDNQNASYRRTWIDRC